MDKELPSVTVNDWWQFPAYSNCRSMAVSSTVVSHDISIEQVHDVLVDVISAGYPVFQKKVGESEVVRSVHGSTA